jgi:hypothetical protein
MGLPAPRAVRHKSLWKVRHIGFRSSGGGLSVARPRGSANLAPLKDACSRRTTGHFRPPTEGLWL